MTARRGELTLAGAVLALHSFSFPWVTHAVVTDVRHYLYFAQRVSLGDVPYRDFFDIKTPLAAVSGALLLQGGQLAGSDPLLAIRAGFVTLSAGAAFLTYLLHCRLAPGRGAGWLGVAPLLGFSLLGLMPAIGNVPKLILAVSATAAALLLEKGRWQLAGAAAAIAFLDWQVGLVVLIAAVLAVLPDAARPYAVKGLVIGFVSVLLPAIVLLAVTGALGDAIAQCFSASLSRGEASWSARGFSIEWDRRLDVVRAGCPGEWWILLLAPLGAARLAVRAAKGEGDGGRTRTLRFLAAHHGMILAFSAVDFQMYGDLFLLLYTGAFLAGVSLWPPVGVGPRRRIWTAAAIGMAALCVRPWSSRGELRLVPTPASATRLEDQRELARHAAPLLADMHRAATLGPTELLFLAGRRNGLPIVVWTPATARYYASSPGEPSPAVLERVLAGGGIDLLLLDPERPVVVSGFRGGGEIRAGTARVVLLEREPGRGQPHEGAGGGSTSP